MQSGREEHGNKPKILGQSQDDLADPTSSESGIFCNDVCEKGANEKSRSWSLEECGEKEEMRRVDAKVRRERFAAVGTKSGECGSSGHLILKPLTTSFSPITEESFVKEEPHNAGISNDAVSLDRPVETRLILRQNSPQKLLMGKLKFAAAGWRKESNATSSGDEKSKGGAGAPSCSRRRMPLDQNDFGSMERGHRVCKLVVFKKFDINYHRLWLNSQTQQIVLSKWTSAAVASTTCTSPSSSCSLNVTDNPSFVSNTSAETTTISGIGRSASVCAVNSGPSCSSSPSRSASSASFSSPKKQTLDTRLIKDIQILSHIGATTQIAEKWRRDPALQRFDSNTVLCISWGAAFIPNNWLILFESHETCALWCHGLRQLCAEQANASHALVVERWLRKQFYSLLAQPTDTACVSLKHMKPFVQQKLQYKVSSKQLQEITENELGFEGFVFAHNWLLDFHSLFMSIFAEYADHECPQQMPFQRFVDFLRNVQHDELGQSRELVSDYLRRYLRDVDPDRDVAEPWIGTGEFIDFLFSAENSLFDPINKEVIHDMNRPLNHYWISSSHNTYLTGDQLKSESSLDAYARALLLGCRCIELDCWDGSQRRGPNGETIIDIVIYHGYTMTSKLALRDVLHTIRHFAFRTSEFPLVLSIEDNCSVPAQRQMAVDIQEVLGELLLTAPVSRDEWELPSPAALRRKIILKHKKLRHQHDAESGAAVAAALMMLEEDEFEQDILSRRCVKKGVLWLRNAGLPSTSVPNWEKHIFVLFHDRLCYLVRPVDDEKSANRNEKGNEHVGSLAIAGRENSLDSQSDETTLGPDEEELPSTNNGTDVRTRAAVSTASVDGCANSHVTEEWFHGRIDREEAKTRLLECAKEIAASPTEREGEEENGEKDGKEEGEEGGSSEGNGIFLVRESGTFIGDFTLSFLHNGSVHHCRIKASIMPGGERRFHLLDTVRKESLYELISHYTRHSLSTPNFKTYLLTPCSQPQPHLEKPWFCAVADTQRAEELLATVGEDGAFLVRHSGGNDSNAFVLSLRMDGRHWHFRLKRDGRLFVVGSQMFENLCQLVDHFGQNQFLRGVCLKHPVNEETVYKYANNEELLLSSTSRADVQFDGCYMELNDMGREFQVEAIEPFNNCQQFEKRLAEQVATSGGKALCFPLGAHITILQKTGPSPPPLHGDGGSTIMNGLGGLEQQQQQQQQLFLGRYNNEVGWFPSRCVREIKDCTDSENNNGVCNELNYGTIELAGTSIEEYQNTDRAHSFRISLAHSHWNVHEYVVAADDETELRAWLAVCQQLARLANDKMQQLRNRERQLRIASQLSSLVVYCQAVPFNPEFKLQDPRTTFFEMCSFSESKHEKLLERGLAFFNQRQLSRVYPQASRFTSTNFIPVPMWNSGCHMVALNFQTGDKAMQLNAGRFAANGRCGYILKPEYLMDETFWQKRDQQQQQSSHHQDSVFEKRSTVQLEGGGKSEKKRRKICLFCKLSRRNAHGDVSLTTAGGKATTTTAGENHQIQNGQFQPVEAVICVHEKLSMKMENSNELQEERGGKSNEMKKKDQLINSEPERNFCTCADGRGGGGESVEAAESDEIEEEPSTSATTREASSLLALNRPILLSIAVIAGRHLSRKNGSYDKGGICSPYVEIELLGFEHDSQSQRTNAISSNGLSPVWQERFHFAVKHPEMCLLRFFVEDGDFVGPKTDPFIGQATMPLDCVRPGFRSVPLLNQFSEPLELSALLVYIEIREWTNPHISSISASSSSFSPSSLSSNMQSKSSSRSSNSTFGVGPSSSLPSALWESVGALKLSNTPNLKSSNPTSSITTSGPPIWNAHQLLQFGRSVLIGPHREALDTATNTNGVKNSTSRANAFESNCFQKRSSVDHQLPKQKNNSLPEELGDSSRSGRRTEALTPSSSIPSTSSSSADSSAGLQTRYSTPRALGTSTLRRIFRLGRNNNNN